MTGLLTNITNAVCLALLLYVAGLEIEWVLLYHMIGNFCGVQIVVDFVCYSYPQKLLNFSYNEIRVGSYAMKI